MDYRSPPRQLTAYSLKRRLRFLTSRLIGARLQKSQAMRFVDFEGTRYKRIILRDSHLAATIEHALEAFGSSVHLPPLAVRYEHEIWTEFVPGRALDPSRLTDIQALAALYSALYSRRSALHWLEDTPFPYRLWSDLRFLARVGVISSDQHEGLVALADKVAPVHVWIGFDYTDPVTKNFIIREDTEAACAIDVESLEQGVLLGWGIAKAKARWLGANTDEFLSALKTEPAADLRGYFDYVELCFLARWTKMGFLERKWKYVDPKRLTAQLNR